jgi:signal transduction histidine kinase
MSPRRPAGLPRFPQITVLGWFRLVFAAIAVLVLVAGVVIIALLAQGRRVSAELSSRLLPAQAQAYRLQGALLDQETGVRGYAITRQADFLQPYTGGKAVEAAAAAQLRTEVAHHPLLTADLNRVEQAALQWRAHYAMPLISLAQQGPPGTAETTLLGGSRQAFNGLRTLFTAQNTDLATAVSAERASLGHVRTINNWTFGLILAAFLLASAATTVVLHNAVVQPLRRLRADSRQVVAGDFGHRIRPSGPADLRGVADDVEAMRSELVTALDSSRSAQAMTARQAADLDAQQAELLRSNAELEQFAYVASHDLQEPLRKVASFCQLLEKRYGDQLDDRGRQYIEFAVDGAKRLQVLINDLLTFSRVGRADDDRFRMPLPMDLALDSALAALSTTIEEAGAVIERAGKLPPVLGDATLLAMLWQNLIANAIKFRSPERPPVIRIPEALQEDGMLRFCIEDNGIGIPPEFAEKVFIIFQRLHGRDVYPGTGIGLALCKRIVEHHGGEISLDPDYQGGTRICFTLPRIEPAERDRSGQRAAAAVAGPAGSSTEGIPA